MEISLALTAFGRLKRHVYCSLTVMIMICNRNNPQ